MRDPLKRWFAKIEVQKTGMWLTNDDLTVEWTDEPCWLWTAYCNPAGYGTFWPTTRQRVYSHRWGYETLVAPIENSDLDIDHRCRQHGCNNPAHLEPVTRKVNVFRGYGAAALNYRKTHCVNGHEYTSANTLIMKDESRRCRACVTAMRSEQYRRLVSGLPPRSAASGRPRSEACGKGHPMEGANVRVDPRSGKRRCAACKLAYDLARKKR